MDNLARICLFSASPALRCLMVISDLVDDFDDFDDEDDEEEEEEEEKAEVTAGGVGVPLSAWDGLGRRTRRWGKSECPSIAQMD